MNAGTLLIVVGEIIALLRAEGILGPDGVFDTSKLDTIQEDVDFGVKVEGILKTHGLNIPGKVDRIIAALPLLAALIQ